MYLGLDVGDVRVGIAALAYLEGIPTPVGTFLRADGQAEAEVLKRIERDGVKTLVVGNPLSEGSSRTAQCESVDRFCRRISRRAPHIEITYVDEYASTKEAEARFFEGRTGMSRKKRDAARQRGVLDALAAVTILESFVQSIQSGSA